MIRMINGITRIGNEVKSSNDAPFSADQSTEQRLVDRGVSVFVEEEKHGETVSGEDTSTSSNNITGGKKPGIQKPRIPKRRSETNPVSGAQEPVK